MHNFMLDSYRIKNHNELLDYFDKHKSQNKIVIAGKEVEEIICCSYSISKNFESFPADPDEQDDLNERQYLTNQSIEAAKKLQEDIYSRQACFVSTYPKTRFGKCIVSVQFLIRKLNKENVLLTNIYMRSQNVDKNASYDLNTFCFMRSMVASMTNSQEGQITILVGSLHRIHEKVS